jgi:hypothetical protein
MKFGLFVVARSKEQHDELTSELNVCLMDHFMY